ncbi:MAG: rRNA pseudouridine synthase [Fibrobacteres bacterium]|nr:rRNA pseudouridine synthase [Fibrobacterota bacterium]
MHGLNHSKHFGLAQAINKAGLASLAVARRLVSQGAVSLNGRIERDPEWLTFPTDQILVEGQPLVAARKIYLMCNKPRGLVTTADDTEGRPTVYRCLEGLDIPHVGPVGRLDMASEGLLLFTNDTQWASAILDPARRVRKTYHVRIDGEIRLEMIERMLAGIQDEGQKLQAISVRSIALPGNARWIEIVLQEGKNREIRRMLKALGLEVLQLVRLRIGPVELGSLTVGDVRHLTDTEVEGLRQAGPMARDRGQNGFRRGRGEHSEAAP